MPLRLKHSWKKDTATTVIKQRLLLETDICLPCHYSDLKATTLFARTCSVLHRARVSLVNIWWQQVVCGRGRLTSQSMWISLGAPGRGGDGGAGSVDNKVLGCGFCLMFLPTSKSIPGLMSVYTHTHRRSGLSSSPVNHQFILMQYAAQCTFQ